MGISALHKAAVKRADAIVAELAARGNFRRVPGVIPDPRRRTGCYAWAWYDLYLIFVTPELLEADERTLRCVLAHEMAHLRLRHGRGDTLGMIGWWLLVLLAVPVVWVVSGSAWSGLLAGGGVWLARHLAVSAGHELYRARWKNDPKEIAADAFAATLIGKEEYGAFCATRNVS